MRPCPALPVPSPDTRTPPCPNGSESARIRFRRFTCVQTAESFAFCLQQDDDESSNQSFRALQTSRINQDAGKEGRMRNG
jgi:hypothetical protein